MVALQEAVRSSKAYFDEVFPPNSVGDLELEGVELSDDQKFWLITFSYWEPDKPSGGFRASHYKRYKTVKLRATDGVFFGIKSTDL